jgi:hypothetical protein
MSVRYAGTMERLPSVRASDSDREQVAERLRLATAEGRLDADELEERLEVLFAARTYGEIDKLVADLPATPASSSPPGQRFRVPVWAGAAAAVTLLLALLGAVDGVRRSAVVVGGPGPYLRHGQFRGLIGSPPFAGAHHNFNALGPIVGLLAIVAVCGAVCWLLLQSNSTTDA